MRQNKKLSKRKRRKAKHQTIDNISEVPQNSESSAHRQCKETMTDVNKQSANTVPSVVDCSFIYSVNQHG